MTPQEMHIALDLGLRKLNSNVFGTLLPEEKDWILNEATLRFIKNRTNPKSNARGVGFEATKKRYDDLEELITPATMQVFRYDSNSVISILPPNHYQSVRFAANVGWDCHDITLATTATSIYYAIVPFPAAGSIAPFFTGLKLDIVDSSGIVTNLFNIINYPTIATGISDQRLQYDLINAIIDQNARNKNVEIWWETFHDVYVPNAFIIVTKQNNAYANTHVNAVISQTSGTNTIAFTSVDLTKYTNTLAKTRKSPLDIVKTEDIDDLMVNSFGTTKYTRPIATLFDGYLRTYHDKRFILNSIESEYIRRPRKISLSLNRSCELNARVHDEVISLTNEVALDYITQRKTVPIE